MRLFCRILQNSLAFCHSCCHHNVDSRTYRNHIQIDMACYQINGMGDHCAAFNLYIRSQRAETFNMLVDGTASNVASAWKRYLSALIFSQQGADKIIRCADTADIFIINGHFFNTAAVDFYCMTVNTIYSCTDLLDSFQHYIDISYIWKVIDQYIIIRHDRGGKNT